MGGELAAIVGGPAWVSEKTRISDSAELMRAYPVKTDTPYI